MLYVLVGSDFPKIKKRIAEITKGYAVARFGEGGESFSDVPSRVGASGLFSEKVALLLDRPLENAEGKQVFVDHAKVFSDADMPVVALLDTVPADVKKQLPKKVSVETFEIEEDDTPQANVFALADAFAKGDRKRSWVLYRQFIESGMTAEEIHGTLSWQARALVLAANAKTASESGLKPFAYTKAKSALAKLPTPPDALSRELISLYHRSRMGEGSLEELLEVFLLKR